MMKTSPPRSIFRMGGVASSTDPRPVLNLPVYLEADVEAYLLVCARARGVDVGQLVNELLKKDIELIEAAR
jgi:hypothetical protein